MLAVRLLAVVCLAGRVPCHSAGNVSDNKGPPLLGSVPRDDIMPNYPEDGKTYRWNVSILVTLTTGGTLPTDLGRSGSAIEMAIREARRNILPDVYVHYKILSRPGMTGCPDEENHATYLITNYAYGEAVDQGIPPVGLLVGPACSVATQHMGRVAADMGLPLVNSQATSDYFDDMGIFKTLTRLAYTMYTLDAFSFRVLDALNYTDVAVIYDEVMPWSQVTGQVFYRAMYYRTGPIVMVPHQLPYKPAGFTNFKGMLEDAKKVSRMILVMAPAKVVRTWMLTAYDLGMCNGDYIFITYEWFRSPYFGEYTWRNGDARDEDARKAYRVLLKIASTEFWLNPSFQKWSAEVKELALSRFGYAYGQDETVAPAVTGMHDGVILYALALNETLAAGEDHLNGTTITRRMWGKTIPSPEGSLNVKKNGVKDQSFVLVQTDNSTGSSWSPTANGWSTVMSYDGITGIFRSDVRPIVWLDGKPLPPNVPACGFQNEKLSCILRDNSSTTVIAVVLAVLIVGVIIAVIAFFVNRKMKFESALRDDWWRIGFDEVKRRNKTDFSSKSLKSIRSRKSTVSLQESKHESIFSLSQTTRGDVMDLSVGQYQGILVFAKTLDCRIPVTRDLLLHLNRLRAIHHDNLNRVVGICVDPTFEAIFTEFCVKQSLSDLIHNERIDLDWSFKFSLVSDLVAGMEFLHNSFLQSHGYLHSSNCVIDGRFVLKVTDFHFPMFRSKPSTLSVNNTDQEPNYKSFLWRAPEHLRVTMPLNGTQKGDVYSTAIILQEITMRTDPYCDHSSTDHQQTDFQIVTRVANLEDPPYRPNLTANIPKEIVTIIRGCWYEQPEDRMTFRSIRMNLKNSKLTKEGNIMDNLLKRMEKYAQDLEALVAERTGAFFEEKKKAEDLLYQVMPKAIADVLKVGGYIPAEAFECVTVYFSDIVGFIALSSESTPFEIVDLLNDVYTIFDGVIEHFDAYKVETISDTYMVASGLPIRNGNRHAFEIARMAFRFLQEVAHFKIRHRPEMKLHLRIGINSGPCAAGVVGLKMPRYCLFGDTINTASRMESTGEAFRIHISDNTKTILDQFQCFQTELRGQIEVKGKGKHTTYWLLGMDTNGKAA